MESCTRGHIALRYSIMASVKIVPMSWHSADIKIPKLPFCFEIICFLIRCDINFFVADNKKNNIIWSTLKRMQRGRDERKSVRGDGDLLNSSHISRSPQEQTYMERRNLREHFTLFIVENTEMQLIDVCRAIINLRKTRITVFHWVLLLLTFRILNSHVTD